MRQAILYGAGDLRIEDRPLDPSSLGANQVYVETIVSGFSTGTDLGNYEGRSTEVPGAPDYPRWVGYSNVGMVRAVGAEVTAPKVGQRVFALKPHQSAYIAPAADLMVPIPENVPSDAASLLYLTQLGMAGMQHANYVTGETVAVIGLGVIGLGTVSLARAMGARVIAIANSPNRLEVARKIGAHETRLSSDAAEARADIVVLTANTWDAYRLAIDWARIRGRIPVLGFPGRAQPAPDFNPLDAKWFYGKQLTLIGAGASLSLRANLEFILFQMSVGAMDLGSIISHRFPAERMRDAYELAKSHSKDLVAAVFDWEGSR
ncbi:MAG: zinc-binding alcohol dehydrogenase [Bryobacteraceae bacterium]